MRRLTWLGVSIPVTLAFATGCGGGDSPTGTGGGSTGASATTSGTEATGTSSSTGAGGGTGTGGAGPTPGDGAGIAGCAAKFVEADGLCHPALDKCPKGTIPKFDEGCVPVGIPGCSDKFLEADGLCHVAISKCPAGTYPVPTEGCVSVDGAAGCGAAPWGAIADGASTIWVDPTYAGGGSDGTKAKPMTTLAAALALAPEAGRVALAAGDYAESIVPTKSVEVVGRCASMVKISGVTGSGVTAASVLLKPTVASLTLRNLQISGPGSGIVILGDATPLKVTIDGVWLNKATRDSLLIDGAGTTVDVKHTFVQSTQPEAAGTLGEGIEVGGGATVTIDASAIVDAVTVGLGVAGTTTKVTFNNGLVEGTSVEPSDQTFGYGVSVTNGSLAVTGSAVVANQTYGAITFGAKTHLSFTGSVIEKTRKDPLNDVGIGVDAEPGGTVDLKSTAVLDNYLVGVHPTGKGCTVTLDQSLVADTLPNKTPTIGGGVSVDVGATLHLLDSTLARNNGVNLSVFNPATKMDAKSCLFESAKLGAPTQLYGAGVGILSGSTGTIDSSAMVANVGAGLVVDTSSSLTMTHSLIADTVPDPKGLNGGGLVTIDPKAVQVSSSAMVSLQAYGVLSTGPLALDGSLIRNIKVGSARLTTKAPLVAGVGDGVLAVKGVVNGGLATVSDSSVEGAARAGFLFANRGGSIKGSLATKNRFGLVLQGTPVPDVGADSTFVGNTETDRVDPGMLPVP